jgi:hypothetical protein
VRICTSLSKKVAKKAQQLRMYSRSFSAAHGLRKIMQEERREMLRLNLGLYIGLPTRLVCEATPRA